MGADHEPERAEAKDIDEAVPPKSSDVPQLRLWRIYWSLTLAVGGAVALVAVLFLAALWVADFPQLRRDENVSASTLFDLMKLIFAVVAGVGGVVALVVAYRRQRVAEATNRLDEFAKALAYAEDRRAEAARTLASTAEQRAALETERDGTRFLLDRYVRAAEQLGSDRAAVRLAGVYSLAGLADDWEANRQTCIDVLCGYLRMPFPLDSPNGSETSVADDLWMRQERQVRLTAIRAIAARLRHDAPVSWRGNNFDLTGATIMGGDFSKAVVAQGTTLAFQGARFTGPGHSFRQADFCGGEVIFAHARFDSSPSMDACRFRGSRVDFRWATFSDNAPSFNGSTLSDGIVTFDSAHFEGNLARFGDWTTNGRLTVSGGRLTARYATFETNAVDLVAEVSGGLVDFGGATFRKGKVRVGSILSAGCVDFAFATFESDLEEIDLKSTKFAGGTIDLSRPHRWQGPPLFTAEEGKAPAGLLLPASDWGFENEVPF